MNSQETLWFVGKCLSLAVHPERAAEIQTTLQSGKINWNSFVYQSSNQLVLPALYLNLKRNNLTAFLPEDLVAHFEDITSQNRKRNLAILKQADEITTFLRSHNLEPVYLKGTAHLLDGLYEDTAERMLSDIDLLLDENNARKAWKILKKSGYREHSKFGETAFDEHRHLSELIKDGDIASVEVHRRLLEGVHAKRFNWSTVESNIKKSKSTYGPSILSDRDLILHNMMNVQMNDRSESMFRLNLRQSYDLMLLAKRENPSEISKAFGYQFNKLNSYIALSADILAYPDILNYESTSKIKRHINTIKLIWKYPGIVSFSNKGYFLFFRAYRYITQFFLFFFRSSTRRRIINSLKNPDYYKAHWTMYKRWFS
jgi:hypothetical protein